MLSFFTLSSSESDKSQKSSRSMFEESRGTELLEGKKACAWLILALSLSPTHECISRAVCGGTPRMRILYRPNGTVASWRCWTSLSLSIYLERLLFFIFLKEGKVSGNVIELKKRIWLCVCIIYMVLICGEPLSLCFRWIYIYSSIYVRRE